MTRRRTLLITAGSATVVVAGVVLLWSTFATSTARLAVSTGTSGFLTAGTVDLERRSDAVGLLFAADGLYPGEIVSSCVAVGYEGSVAADVRLHGAVTGGSSLEDHVRLRLWTEPDGSCPEPGESESSESGTSGSESSGSGVSRSETGGPPSRPTSPPTFDGLLADLWSRHPDFARGLPLLTDAGPGDGFALWAEAELAGGDEAQGRTTDFTITIEARP